MSERNWLYIDKDSAPSSVSKHMPDIVWRYLFDADIRQKNDACAVAQADALLCASTG